MRLIERRMPSAGTIWYGSSPSMHAVATLHWETNSPHQTGETDVRAQAVEKGVG